MISAELKPANERRLAAIAGKPRLVLERLTLHSGAEFGTSLQSISVSVAGGEILGIAGIAGNGQGELMDALSGETLAGRPETVILDGVPAGHMGPQDRRRLGGCFVPEERNGHGAVTTMSLADNGLLSGHLRGALVRLGIIDQRRTHAFADKVIQRFDVRTTGAKAVAKSLSGGNLQKFLVGREVLLDPSVLVISQPTWGVDAGAALAIHEAIIALAAGGAAVVIISQDLDEILLLADRIAVIAAGRLSEPIPVGEATIEQIGLLMGGVSASAEPTPPAKSAATSKVAHA
jgi:simple sugar transport system ATP-binding protein